MLLTHRDIIRIFCNTTLEKHNPWDTTNLEYDWAHYVSKCHFMVSMFAKDNNNHATLKNLSNSENHVVQGVGVPSCQELQHLKQ